MKRPRNECSFTLIELMTVATIIGILAAIAVPNFMNAAIRAKTARSISEQELLVWALEMYSLDRDAYPPNQENGKSLPPDLNPLSTPIPYLSVVPYDVYLHPGHQERGEFIESQRGGNPNYFYINFLQITGQRQSLRDYNLSGSANYVVYGLGPTFNTEGHPLKPDTFLSYDPSNGTTSLGFITTFAP